MQWEKGVEFLVIRTREVNAIIMRISIILIIRLIARIKTIMQINVIQTTQIMPEDNLLANRTQIKNKESH